MKDGKLQLSHAICGICGREVPFTNSPGNMKKHLTGHHKTQFEAVEKANDDQSKASSASQAKLTDFMNFSSSKTSVKYQASHPKQKKFRQLLVRWIVASKRSFSQVEDQGFIDILNLADSGLTVPSARTVSRDIDKVYKTKVQETKKNFEEVDHFGVTTDAGSSSSGKSFIDINCHWVDKKTFEAKKKTIEVIKVDSKTAKDYRKVVDNSLTKFGVKEKTVCFTTDNEPTMRKCFKPRERNGCFSHIESKSSQKSLDSSARLKRVRKKIRKVARKSNKSPKFKSTIAKEQLKRGLKSKVVQQEIATRFTCTHDMFGSVLHSPSDNYEDPEVKAKIDRNVEAINKAMELTLPKDYDKLYIEETDVTMMVKLMPTLDVLEEGIRILGGENYCSASSVLPFLAQFTRILETSDESDDPSYVVLFKKELLKQLKKRCQDNLNFSLLAKSSFFDKRFSKMDFLSSIDFPPGKSIVKEQLLEEITAELGEIAASEDSVTVEAEAAPAPKKARFLSSLCDSESMNETTSKNDPKNEIERYQKERPLTSTDDPLKWWSKNRNIYPLLAKLAMKYLCIQATSTAAERSFSLLGNIMTKRRMSLTDEHVNMLSFLSDCI